MTDAAHILARAYLDALPPVRRLALRRAVDRGDVLPGLGGGADIRAALREAFDQAGPERGVPAQIAGLLAEDRQADALALLRQAGGAFLSMTLGLEQARAVAAGFPAALRDGNSVLRLLDAVNALKSGNVARADQVLGDQCLPEDTTDADLPLLCVLYMKAVYEDEPISDRALGALSDVLARLPGDDALMHGLLHNVGLDVFLRQGQSAMAEEAALHALHQYNAAGLPGLAFYVRLYLALIALDGGDDPRPHLDAAQDDLCRFEGASDNDRLLWKFLDLIAQYEEGTPEPLIRHLTQDQETIPYGELWPAMAAPMLAYGRRALTIGVGPVAALDWVRKWQLRQWRSKRFDQMIAAQEAAALQDAGRWQEAEEVLASLRSPTSGAARLPRLASALDRAPASEELGRKLREAAAHVDQPVRQRVGFCLLAARSAVQRQAGAEAARHLAQALDVAPHTRLPMIWREATPALVALRRTRALKDDLSRQPRLRRALSAIIEAGRDEDVPEALTPREFRVLLLLAEGAQNKAIAQRLGISLPTVKFHVGNLSRKADARGRRAVVARAQERGWIS